MVTFARVFVTAFTGNGAELLAVSWPRLIEILAALTIVYGNLVALNQLNVKRMLGYSAVAHAGYLLIGVAALPAFAVAGASTHSLGVGSALLYYLLAYSFANLAAFGVLALFGRGGREDLDSFVLSGAARRHPVLALVLSLALISLAGIPPTAGFFGKFLLLRGVLAARPDLLWLIIIAVLGSAASMFYYLRPVIRMYMHPEHEPVRTIRSGAAWAGLAIAAALLLHAGIMPGRYLQATDRASASLDLSPKVVEVVKVTERR